MAVTERALSGRQSERRNYFWVRNEKANGTTSILNGRRYWLGKNREGYPLLLSVVTDPGNRGPSYNVSVDQEKYRWQVRENHSVHSVAIGLPGVDIPEESPKLYEENPIIDVKVDEITHEGIVKPGFFLSTTKASGTMIVEGSFRAAEEATEVLGFEGSDLELRGHAKTIIASGNKEKPTVISLGNADLVMLDGTVDLKKGKIKQLLLPENQEGITIGEEVTIEEIKMLHVYEHNGAVIKYVQDEGFDSPTFRTEGERLIIDGEGIDTLFIGTDGVAKEMLPEVELAHARRVFATNAELTITGEVEELWLRDNMEVTADRKNIRELRGIGFDNRVNGYAVSWETLPPEPKPSVRELLKERAKLPVSVGRALSSPVVVEKPQPRSGYTRVEPVIRPPDLFQTAERGDPLRWRSTLIPGFALSELSWLGGPEAYQSNKIPQFVVVTAAQTPLSITSEATSGLLVINPFVPVEKVEITHPQSVVLILTTEKRDGVDVSTGVIWVDDHNPYIPGETQSISFAEALTRLPQPLGDEVKDSPYVTLLNPPSPLLEWKQTELPPKGPGWFAKLRRNKRQDRPVTEIAQVAKGVVEQNSLVVDALEQPAESPRVGELLQRMHANRVEKQEESRSPLVEKVTLNGGSLLIAIQNRLNALGFRVPFETVAEATLLSRIETAKRGVGAYRVTDVVLKQLALRKYDERTREALRRLTHERVLIASSVPITPELIELENQILANMSSNL